MTLFVTTNSPHDSSTNALDEEDAGGGKKVQNVRRRRTMDGPKTGIKMFVLQASSASAVPPMLLLFALCASLVSAQPQYHPADGKQQQQRDADTVAAEFIALQYPQPRFVEEQGQLPYQSDTVGQEHAFLDNTVLQKRMLVPPQRMVKLAQLMNKQNGVAAAGRTKVTAYDETNEEEENSSGYEESDSRRWRQNNGGMWAKRHIKDSSSPAGFQKMDEFKNNMMRALINLRRYRR